MGANDPQGGTIFDPRGMIGRIYIEDHYTNYYIQNMKALGLGVLEKKIFYVFPNDPRGGARMDPRGTVGTIYKEDHKTLLHIIYESSGPYVFGEEDFLKFFP